MFEREGPVVGERGETTVKAESWLQDVLGGWQQAQGRGSGPCHRWSVVSGRFLCPRSCPQRPPISVLPGTRQMLSGANQARRFPAHNPEGAGPPSSSSPPVKWEKQIQLLRAVVTTRNHTRVHTHTHSSGSCSHYDSAVILYIWGAQTQMHQYLDSWLFF